MMEIRTTHWMAALVLSVAIHSLIVQLIYSPGGPGTTGSRGVSVQLGSYGVATEALVAPAEFQVTEAAPRLAPAEDPVPQAIAPLPPRIPRSIEVAPPLPDTRLQNIEFAAEPAMTAAGTKHIGLDITAMTEVPHETAHPRQEFLEPVTANPLSALDTPDVATAGQAVAAAATVAPGESTNPEPSAAGQPGAAGSGRTGLDQDYYSELAIWLGRHKRYPSRARRGGQEGTVEVEFVIDRDGRLLEHRIVSSSGFELLDEAAYALIERAAPMPSIPEEMDPEVLTITAPISFSLR